MDSRQRRGFEGSWRTWWKEFDLLRQKCNHSQVRLEDFTRLVNEEFGVWPAGCYATNEILELMIKNSDASVSQ
eukprot:s3988_g3.t1